MKLDAIPLFSMLKGRLGYLDQRQKLIAENVANADTPGYAPRDLKPFTFGDHLKAQASPAGVAAVRTHAMHMPSPNAPGAPGWTTKVTPGTETTLDGNKVVLEEEMLKMSEARMGYDAAVGFYQKSLGLLRLAARPPGRG
jgi:flagellar basal-body rod protein FlgB